MTIIQTTPTAHKPSAGDQTAVAHLPKRIIAAWAEHDADAFAEVFTENATMILPGVFRKGRDDIRAFMAGAFAGPYRGTRVTGQPVNVEFFDANTGVLITRGGVLAPGETTVSPERGVVASWIVVKRDGRWQLASYQNSPCA